MSLRAGFALHHDLGVEFAESSSYLESPCLLLSLSMYGAVLINVSLYLCLQLGFGS